MRRFAESERFVHGRSVELCAAVFDASALDLARILP